jgi:hypothetical protein
LDIRRKSDGNRTELDRKWSENIVHQLWILILHGWDEMSLGRQ